MEAEKNRACLGSSKGDAPLPVIGRVSDWSMRLDSGLRGLGEFQFVALLALRTWN